MSTVASSNNTGNNIGLFIYGLIIVAISMVAYIGALTLSCSCVIAGIDSAVATARLGAYQQMSSILDDKYLMPSFSCAVGVASITILIMVLAKWYFKSETTNTNQE